MTVVRFRGISNVDDIILHGMEGENETFSLSRIHQYERQYIRVIIRVYDLFWGLSDITEVWSESLGSTGWANITVKLLYGESMVHISVDNTEYVNYVSSPMLDVTLSPDRLVLSLQLRASVSHVIFVVSVLGIVVV